MEKISDQAILIAVITGVLLSAVAFWGWRTDQDTLEQARQQNVELAGRFISEQFLGVIDHDIQTLENLKGRIEITGGDYFDYWDYDAHQIMKQHRSFAFMEWIDSTGVVRWVLPELGNENALGLDILQLDYRRDDWLRMKRDSTTNLTSWTPLVQGGSVFLADAPLYYNGSFQGSITAGMDFRDLFDDIMAGRDIYDLLLVDDRGSVFYTYSHSNDVEISGDCTLIYREKLLLPAGNHRFWTFTLMPNARFYAEIAADTNHLGLILRLLVSILLAAAIFFLLTLLKTNRAYKKSLREKEILISEIHHRVKNNLAVITSLIEIQSGEIEDEEMLTVLRNTRNRIFSIAGVHEVLYSTQSFSEISFETYLQKLFHHLLDVYGRSPENISLILNIEKKKMNINQAIPIGLIMNELAVNSFKHAFSDQKIGKIQIDVLEEEGQIKIIYQDNGAGFDARQFHTGTTMGLTIIKTLLKQLQAEYSVEDREGFRIEFSFLEAGK